MRISDWSSDVCFFRSVLTIDQAERGVIIGVGILQQLVVADRADHDVADAGAQGVANESHAVGIPGVAHGHAEFLGEKLGDLVLEALSLLVRDGKVAGLGADAHRRDRKSTRLNSSYSCA